MLTADKTAARERSHIDTATPDKNTTRDALEKTHAHNTSDHDHTHHHCYASTDSTSAPSEEKQRHTVNPAPHRQRRSQAGPSIRVPRNSRVGCAACNDKRVAEFATFLQRTKSPRVTSLHTTSERNTQHPHQADTRTRKQTSVVGNR